jgi:hypothetical protein
MSPSAYIRGLIDRDIAEASTGEQEPWWAREMRAAVARMVATDEHRKAP